MFGVPKITAPTGLYPSNPSSLPTPGFTPLMTPPGAAQHAARHGGEQSPRSRPRRGGRRVCGRTPRPARRPPRAARPCRRTGTRRPRSPTSSTHSSTRRRWWTRRVGGKKDESGPAFLSLPDVWTTQHVEKAEDKVRGGAACVVCVWVGWCARCEDWRLESETVFHGFWCDRSETSLLHCGRGSFPTPLAGVALLAPPLPRSTPPVAAPPAAPPLADAVLRLARGCCDAQRGGVVGLQRWDGRVG